MSLIPLAPFILLILSKNKKTMRRKIAWPSLASFGGITRIRFKGFDQPFSSIISARRLPRTNFSVRLRRARMKSTDLW
jgi:hypothetical protein